MSRLPKQTLLESTFPDLLLTPSLVSPEEEDEYDKRVEDITTEVSEFSSDVMGLPLYTGESLTFLESAHRAIQDVKIRVAEKKEKNKHNPCRAKLADVLFRNFDDLFALIQVSGRFASLLDKLSVKDAFIDPAIQDLINSNSVWNGQVLQHGKSILTINDIKLIIGNYFYLFVDRIVAIESNLIDDDINDSRTIGLKMKNSLNSKFLEIFGFDIPNELQIQMMGVIDAQYSTTPAYMDRVRNSYNGMARANVERIWGLKDEETWWELYKESAKFLIEMIRKGDPALAKKETDVQDALHHITSKLFRGVSDLFPEPEDVDSLSMNFTDLLLSSIHEEIKSKDILLGKEGSIGQRLLNIMNSTVVCDKKSWARHTVCRILIELMEGRTNIESNLGYDTQQEMTGVRKTVISRFMEHNAEHVGTQESGVDQFKIVLITKDGKKLPVMIEVAPNKNAMSAWRKAISKGADYPTMLDLVRMRMWLVGGKSSNQEEVDEALSYGYAYALEVLGNTIPYVDRMKYHFDQFEEDDVNGGFSQFSEGQNTFKGFVKINRPSINKLMSNKGVELQIGTDFPDHNHDSYENKQFKACKEFMGANSFQQFTFDLIDYCIDHAPKDKSELKEMHRFSSGPNGPSYIQMFTTLLRILLNPDSDNFTMLAAKNFMTKYSGEYETNIKLATIIGILNKYYNEFNDYFVVGDVIERLKKYKDLMKERYDLEIKKKRFHIMLKQLDKVDGILNDTISDDEKREALRLLGFAPEVIEAHMGSSPESRSQYYEIIKVHLTNAREQFRMNWQELLSLRSQFKGLIPDPK
jgi:hypothetical protein